MRTLGSVLSAFVLGRAARRRVRRRDGLVVALGTARRQTLEGDVLVGRGATLLRRGERRRGETRRRRWRPRPLKTRRAERERAQRGWAPAWTGAGRPVVGDRLLVQVELAHVRRRRLDVCRDCRVQVGEVLDSSASVGLDQSRLDVRRHLLAGIEETSLVRADRRPGVGADLVVRHDGQVEVVQDFSRLLQGRTRDELCRRAKNPRVVDGDVGEVDSLLAVGQSADAFPLHLREGEETGHDAADVRHLHQARLAEERAGAAVQGLRHESRVVSEGRLEGETGGQQKLAPFLHIVDTGEHRLETGVALAEVAAELAHIRPLGRLVEVDG